jgi:hypothetical protein
MDFKTMVGRTAAAALLLATQACAQEPPSCTGNRSNGTVYVADNASWDIVCAVDYAGGDMKAAGVTSFKACIDLCDSTAGCIDVSYAPWGMCWMKNVLT